MTENTKPVPEMCQEERRAFAAREGNGEDADFPDDEEGTRVDWVYVPDMHVDVLRKLVWPTRPDAQMHNTYRSLTEQYRVHAKRLDPDNPNRSIKQMMEWWTPHDTCYPLVFTRQFNGWLSLWDGVHRLYHCYLTKARETVPALIGVPRADHALYKPTVDVNGETVALVRRRYENDRPGLQGFTAEGPYCTFTVNLPDEDMDENEVVIKNWSEQTGFLDVLEAQGVVRRTGRVIPSKYVEAPTALLLV